MVLAALGQQVGAALKKIVDSNSVTAEVLDEVIKDLSKALIIADVPIAVVNKFRDRVRKRVNLKEIAPSVDVRVMIQQAVFEELVAMMTPTVDGEKVPTFKPKRNKFNVIMMVGLQGSGKTTTCGKIARHYKKKGFRVALIGADTFRAGARDQLAQLASTVPAPCFTSDVDDPAQVAREGVARFREAGYEVVIVDTSGRTQQDEALMAEMAAVKEAANPDHIMFIMDGTNSGKIIALQSEQFHSIVGVGSHVITKLDSDDTKGGGALTSVVSTGAPIAFIGVGETMNDMQEFNPESFVSRMLGMGDIGGLINKMKNAGLDSEKSVEVVTHMLKGETSFRDIQEQLRMMDSMLDGGSITDFLKHLPGMGGLGQLDLDGQDGMGRLRKVQYVFDSMTPGELDSAKINDESRLRRIAMGSGVPLEEIKLLFAQLKKMANLFSMMGKGLGKGGLNPGKLGNMNPRDMEKMMSSMMGGLGRGGGAMGAQMQQMMRQMGGPAGMANMERMMSQMGGMGGMPGMGGMDMGAMMKMAKGMGLG
ncbi:signal recognition particle protein SRP54 [Carpediemonas membranifera]|uniref:signal-recognition-particle GTPase n=1 Tax=Carpediemonas membranifera TaxID=201153 RepID=A0A8J6BZ63_9EUKA|nr:signal recognition particle protein SRP54 [Carpediemonas membranifera]|eukprot:KAG9395226.1 signal recognition particle protein SRP54 [Carpediemonas membranifera]